MQSAITSLNLEMQSANISLDFLQIGCDCGSGCIFLRLDARYAHTTQQEYVQKQKNGKYGKTPP